MKRRGQRQRGFTLIEVMMVVAILGLMLTMGFPAFLKIMKREGMRKVEYEMVEACKEARRSAIMNNKTATLVIHPMLRTFEVPGAYETCQIPGDIVIDILGVNFVQLENADTATVRFFSNGTSDEFTVVLHSSGGIYRKIFLDTITGLPDIENIR